MQPDALQWFRGHVSRHPVGELSKGAQHRLRWFDYYQRHGQNAALTCRYFGISRQTFYRWKQKYGGLGVTELRRLRQLEEENRKLKQLDIKVSRKGE